MSEKSYLTGVFLRRAAVICLQRGDFEFAEKRIVRRNDKLLSEVLKLRLL